MDRSGLEPDGARCRASFRRTCAARDDERLVPRTVSLLGPVRPRHLLFVQQAASPALVVVMRSWSGHPLPLGPTAFSLLPTELSSSVSEGIPERDVRPRPVRRQKPERLKCDQQRSHVGWMAQRLKRAVDAPRKRLRIALGHLSPLGFDGLRHCVAEAIRASSEAADQRPPVFGSWLRLGTLKPLDRVQRALQPADLGSNLILQFFNSLHGKGRLARTLAMFHCHVEP